MKATLFYFSGTGNSLYVSKKVAGLLCFDGIVNVSRYSERERVELDGDMIGFVFPVYSQTIPGKLKRFLGNAAFVRSPYIFSIATHNGEPGRANFDIAGILEKKNQRLSGGFSILMPGNSIIVKDYTNPPEERERRLRDSEDEIVRICRIISESAETTIDGDRSLGKYCKGLVTRAARRIYNVPKRFTVGENCNRCGSCVRLCPENNISLTGSVAFGNKCSDCLACYHWCPRNAIRLGNGTRTRYHHPEIKMAELFLR